MTEAALLRSIPAVDEVLRRPEVAVLASEAAPSLIAAWVREALEEVRRGVREGRIAGPGLASAIDALPERLKGRLSALSGPPLRRIINATGVVVHTNLGRAPLGPGALDALMAAGAGYNDLEYDLGQGERGSRGAHLREAASALFPGQSLLAVNNNAAAVLLALNTLSEGREAIVSRGELVEIGGSFRIPEVMAKAGAVLREVGTTNRTRLEDYRAALSDRTGLLVKVHTSNYRIVGFVEEAPVSALAGLAQERGVPLLVDEGSGHLGSLETGAEPGASGLSKEPIVQDLLTAGASLVTFSGDKLLGGPQAGLLVGDPTLVARCAKNPLARALRLDKTRLAALAWTLGEHAAGRAHQTVPVLEMCGRASPEIDVRARALKARIDASDAPLDTVVEDGVSRVGGGAAPMRDLPTRVLAVRSRAKSADAMERALRGGSPPVVARIADDRLLVDLRTVDPAEDEALAAALVAAALAPHSK